MTSVRRHLHALTLAWLVCQLASLSALLPPACCAAHESLAERECHDAASAVCPMHAADGALCPMHAGSAHGNPDRASAAPAHGHATIRGHATRQGHELEHGEQSGQESGCSMRGLCNAPAVALSALLSAPGVVPDTTGLSFDRTSTPIALAARFLSDRQPPHDTPPPRL